MWLNTYSSYKYTKKIKVRIFCIWLDFIKSIYILNFAHGNVVVVRLSTMSKNFFLDWKGDFINPFSKNNQWSRAQGSSLSNKQKAILNRGGIVLQNKDDLAVKVFAKDSCGNIWSVIVPTDKIEVLKADLARAGFVKK